VTVVAVGASGTSSSTNTATALPLHNKTTSTGVIAGASVGSVAIIAIIALAAVLFFRGRSKKAAAAPPPPNNGQAEYFAPAVGGQPPNGGQYPPGQPPRFSQVEYMNNPPAMTQNGAPAYPQQNGSYGAYAPPVAVAGQQGDWKPIGQQGWKADGSRGVVEANVMPAGPLTPLPPGVQEVYGSPVQQPVEMPVHPR
jgi:hypothetical protein